MLDCLYDTQHARHSFIIYHIDLASASERYHVSYILYPDCVKCKKITQNIFMQWQLN